MITALLLAAALAQPSAHPEPRLVQLTDAQRALKHDVLERRVADARVDALHARMEGAGFLIGAVALPAAGITGVVLTAPAGRPAKATWDTAPMVFSLATLASTCVALPAGLLVGLSRIGEAEALEETARANDAQLRAFDAESMRY